MSKDPQPIVGRVVIGAWIGALVLCALEIAGRALSRGVSAPAASELAASFAVASLLGVMAGLLLGLLLRLANVRGPAFPATIGALSRGTGSNAVALLAGLAAAALVTAGFVPVRAMALGAPSVSGLVSAGAAVLAFAAFALATAFVARGVRLKPRGRTVGIAALAASVAAAAVAATMRTALEPSGLWDLCLVGVGVLAAFGAILVVPSTRRFCAAALVVAGVCALGGVVALVGLEKSSRMRESLGYDWRPTNWAVAALSTAVDLDGDGYSPLFGGGDCNDFDEEINPDAIEISGNGLDDNCVGGDREAVMPWPPRPTFVPLPSGATAPSGFLVISVDALRPDHMSTYGYGRKTTPRIDALAQGSAVFTRAYSTAPTTRIAIPALFTGRSLGEIAWNRRVFPYKMLDRNTTLAEILEEKGFTSAAFVTHRYLGKEWNFTQGFDEVDETLALDESVFRSEATGAALAERAAKWIAAHADKPFLVWVHIMDPHRNYVPHPEGTDFGPEPEDLYDGEIEYSDRAIGVLLDQLETSGVAAKTAVAILADHGEYLGEHGRSVHGGALWEVGNKIPLIIKAPGFGHVTSDCVVGHSDIMCTLLNLAGIDCGKSGASAATLVPEMSGAACDPKREIVLEMKYGPRMAPNLKVLVGERWKLHMNAGSQTFQLYDLREDPGEDRNVAGEKPEILGQMKGRLLAWTEVFDNREIADIRRSAVIDELPGDATPLRVRFDNGLVIVGADLARRRVSRDVALDSVLYLRADRPIREKCVIYHYLVDGDGEILLEDKHVPLNGTFPMKKWPAKRIVADPLYVDVRGGGVRRGPARLEVGVKCGSSFLTVTAGAGSDSKKALLGEIKVVKK